MGRVFKPKYTYKRADGTKVEKITEAWYIEYADAGGRWIRRKAGLTKEQARDALRKAEMDVLDEKNGLPVNKFNTLTCQDLMTAYLQAQKHLVCPDHAANLKTRIKNVLRNVALHYVKDIQPEVMDKYLNRLAAEGKAARTINTYLQAIKGMLRWAVMSRKIPYNPLECVRTRPERKKHRQRRALREEEIARLLIIAQDGPRRRRLRRFAGGYAAKDKLPEYLNRHCAREGRNVVMAYRLMLESGFRRKELANLTWADVDLANGIMHFRSEWTKNGKEEALPVAPGLLRALREWKLQCAVADTEPVVRVTSRLLDFFDDDLKTAGIEKGEPASGILDLHALRHTFGTRLGQLPGIDPKTVQTLMRHSDPRLTFAVYVHSDQDRLKTALAQFPDVPPKADDAGAASAAS